MNYKAFDLHSRGEFLKGQEMTPQEYMERLFLFALQPTERKEAVCISEMFWMKLVSCNEECMSLCVEICAEEWKLNPGGTLHGGMMATAIDITMGMLVRFLERVTKQQLCS